MERSLQDINLLSHLAADRIDVIRPREGIVNHHTKKTLFETNLMVELCNWMAHPLRSELCDLDETIIPSIFSLLTVLVRPLASSRLFTKDRA